MSRARPSPFYRGGESTDRLCTGLRFTDGAIKYGESRGRTGLSWYYQVAVWEQSRCGERCLSVNSVVWICSRLNDCDAELLRPIWLVVIRKPPHELIVPTPIRHTLVFVSATCWFDSGVVGL